MSHASQSAPPEQRDEIDAVLSRAERGSRKWLWLLMSGALVATATWVVVAARALERDPTVVESPLIGKPAPALRLPAMGGGEVDLVASQGDIVVVNFWASWCVPCQEEAPELRRFAERWSGQGVRVVGVVYADDEAAAIRFRDRFGLTYPQALDPEGRAAIDFGVFGVPETFVIDRRGVVMAKLIGAVDARTLEAVVGSVEAGRSEAVSNERYRTSPER